MKNSEKFFIFAEKPGKLGENVRCYIIVNENVFQGTFLSRVFQGKVRKYPGNLRENSGNLVSQKCGHPGLEP